MMKKLTVVGMALAVLFTAIAPAQATPLPHPRIWINSAILTRMQTARTNNTAEWQTLQNYCDSHLGQNMQGGYNFLDWYAAVMNYSLAYRVSGNASYGSEGVKYLTALLRDKTNVGDGLGGATAITTDSGYVARSLGTGVAVGRDWLDGASGLTSSLINECAARLNDWITWYNANGYSRTDPTDNYYSGYFTMVYTASIGLEGDPNYQSAWQTQAESMWTTVVGFMNGQGYKADWLEGWNYGPWSVREYIGYPFALETGTTRDNHWSQTTWAADLVTAHIHMLYPSRAMFEDNGSWSGNYKGDPRSAVCLMCSIMSPNNATTKGLAVWFAHHLAWNTGSSVSEWEGLLYTDSSVTEVAPTVSNMGGLAYLMYGHSVSRSADWTNLNATYVDAVGRPIDGEGDLNVGEVKIGSRGHILLIDGRTYEYGSDLGNVPDIAGSHLYAPLQEWWHDAVTFNMDNVDAAYTYSRISNINTCYDGVNSENPDTSYFRRDVAFLRPDFIAVFDNIVTASTSNTITEKWYTAGQPTINGATASITLGSAKLFTNTVDPAASVTSAANTGSRTPAYNPNESFSGVYKLLISPSAPSTSNNILQLFETADSTQGSMTAYDKLTPTGFLGASIKHAANPRVVLFATAQNPAATSCSFNFMPVASPTKVLIIGMQASTNFSVTVTDGGGGSKNVTVATGSGYTSTANGALSFDVTTGPSPLQITTTSLPADTLGIAYNQTLQATGGTTPYTWAISSGSLPSGLSIVASTGAITGTPTASGTSSFTARVTDNVSATATQALSIVVNAAVTITTSSLPNGAVGTSYSQTMAATGGTGALTWSLQSGSLPVGLSLVAGTGAITGTPTASGTSNFTARATDTLGATGTKALSIIVTAGALTITTSSLPADTVGIAYNQTLTAAGGSTPYTWAVLSGSLPTGLSLNTSTGAITGTPSAAGTSNFTARVTDNVSATATKALSIVVNAAPSITTSSLPGGMVGTSYSQTLSATGGTTPLTWSLLAGSLPSGLSLVASTGAITGTPSASGTSSFTAKVTDSVTASATKALSIAISAAPSDPTYQQAASDSETSTTSTTWQNKTTLAFTPAVSDTWLILAFGEYKGSSASYASSVRLTVDGAEEGLNNMMVQNANEYYSFAVSKVTTLGAASHTLAIDYCSSNAAQTTYLRRARIVAIRKATLDMYSNAADSDVGLTNTTVDYVTATFAPATAGDYLMIFTAESMGQWGSRTFIDAKLNGNVLDEGQLCSRADVNYDSFASFCVATLPASSQTIALSAYKEGAGWQNIRRCRVAAIRLSGDRFANYSSAVDDTQTGTTSTTFVEKLTKTWSSGSTGNWLLLASARLQGTGGQTAEMQVQYNNSTTLAQPMRTFQAGNEWRNENAVAVQNIVAGGRQQDIDYRTANASYTVSIKYAHQVMLPLDTTLSPLSITTTSLPADTVGVAYNQTLSATGGQTPYTWSIASGSLPAGISLVGATGVISGTPSASGTSNLTIQVTDSQGTPATATQALSIVVNAPVSISTASLPADTVGVAYNQTLAATGGTGALAWSISSGSLPAGLSIVAGTGAITGTPTTAGTSNFTAMATDTVGANGTKAFSIVINAAISITTSSLPADTVNIAYNQTLAATGGTGALTWSLNAGSLPTGLTLTSGGSITGTPTAAGTSSFTVRAADTVNASATKALSIVIDAAVSITTASLPVDTVGVAYSQTLAATGGTGSLTWSISSGSLPAGLSIVAATGAITGTPTASGTSSFTARATDTVGATGTKALSIVVNAAPSITTSSLPGGSVGVAYNQTMAATGGTTPLAWSISPGSLPAGLSLVASTGAITGTPTASGTSNFTARVTDTVGATATKALSIVIVSGLTITTSSLPADTVGAAYNQTLTASGGTSPYSWSISGGSLPAGLSIVASTGAITGTPTTAGTSNFTAMVTDNVSATATKALSIVINPAITITTSSLPADTVGIAYNQTLAATGGTGALTWSISSGSLPAGLSLDAASGAITGTPTASGASNFTARATDTVSATATKALSIVVNAAITVTTASLPPDTVGIAYNQTLYATGGTGVLTWSISSGLLPAGLSLSASTGAITGTPTASGTSSFTARATDTLGATGTKALSIVVNAVPSITTSSLPDGTVGTAYSQTLSATGGTGALTWSLNAGSLPAGLSLTSGGSITGTPTASGTSSFTGKVTDAVTASATKALSIIVSGTAGDPLYQQAASDTQSTTTSTAFQNKVSLQFTPTTADTYLILGFAEYTSDSISYTTSVRLTVDGTVEGLSTMMVKATTEYYAFTASKAASLSAATHTINIDYASGDASMTSYIRRARIVAIRKASLEMYSNSADTEVGTTNSSVDYCTVNFTPATAGDYLLIWTAESMGQWSWRTFIDAKLNGAILDEGQLCSKADVNYDSFASFAVATLPASSQTVVLAAYKEGQGFQNIRRCRVTAIRLSDSRLSAYAYSADDTSTGTTSTTFVQKLSKTWTSGSTGNWLLLGSGRLNPTGTAMADMQAQYNDTTTLASIMRSGQAANEWKNFSYFAVQNITGGTRQQDTDYRSDAAGSTTNIMYTHEVMLPLDEGGVSGPTITTASLPNGQVASAYNQTLAATGGTTPYTWSVQTGSLPAGLSLSASTGAITGTPTTSGTSNFTALVTDSLSASATKALSIIVDPAPATYQFAASDSEATTTSTNYTNKATLSFTPGVSDTWVVMGFAELKNSSTSRLTSAQLTIDGGVTQDTTLAPKNNTDYQSFVGMKVVTLSAAAHTINIDYKTSASAGTAYIRRARIVAIRQASLLISSADEGDTGHDVTTTMTDYVTTSFTPATAGDYLLIWSTAMNGNTTSYATNIEARLNGTAQDTCSVRNNNTSNYVTFLSVQMANLAASSQTISLAAAKDSGSSATHHVKRSRVTAIRLSGSRFAGYQSNAANTESTTTSTTFQNKLTQSWTPAAAGNWLVLTSFRMTNSSTSYSTEGQVTVDDSTTSAQPLKRIQATTDYLPMGSVDVRNLTAAAHHMDVNYRSASTSGTAKIKYVRFMGLPL